MERSKSRRASYDELAVVKAAAWAWYERSSVAFEAKATEFDLRRTWQPPPPSRYKREAMRAMRGQLQKGHENSSTRSDSADSTAASPSPRSTRSDSVSSLFDSYEVARIAKQLNCALEASRKATQSGRGQRRGPAASPSTTFRPKAVKTSSLFWARQAIGVCGTTVEAVVAPAARRRGKVAGVNGHRPRAHAADV